MFQVESSGLSLEQVSSILTAHSKVNTAYFVSDTTVEEFRVKAKQSLENADSSKGVIINYHMATLGQASVVCHHSVLAAYHPPTDRFLLLDTWPDTQSCWARTDDLFRAMNTVDPRSGKTRGFCVVTL